MSPKEERKQDAKNGHIKELIEEGYICDRKSGKDYVFISYSSLNWKKVLHDIVYETCKKYGLQVYFDTKFDEGSDSWITQFRNNMNDEHCKAVLAFFSPEYYSSYATLMELMTSQTIDVGEVLVLPINLGSSNVSSVDNTGLGTYRFSDNSTNELWGPEMELFNELFIELTAFNIFDPYQAKALYPKGCKVNTSNIAEAYWEELDRDRLFANDAYWRELGINTEEEKRNKWDSLGQAEKNKKNDVFLSKKKNAMLMQMLRAKIDKNTIDGVNKDIPKAIYDKLCAGGLKSVFGAKVKPPIETCSVTFKDEAVISQVTVEKGEKITSPEKPDKEDYIFKGWLNGTQLWDFEKDIVQTDLVLTASWEQKVQPPVPQVDGYTYTIFGKEYHAGKREQGKLMYDVFAALVEKFPDKVELLTARTSVARVGDVTNPNTQQAKPPYFRACERFTVGAQDYFVGTSYGLDAKKTEIREMLKICGVSPSEFILVGDTVKPDNGGKGDKHNSQEDAEQKGFEYSIFEKLYLAGAREQGKLMYDVFECLMEKHPDKISLLTACTSVEKKENVQNRNTDKALPSYFRASDHKPYIVEGQEYYVGTSYGLEAKIAQIKQMLKICGEDESAFQIISQPEKKKRNRNDSKKPLNVDEM